MTKDPSESQETAKFLLAEAGRLISENPSAMQVNLIAAASGRVYSFLRPDLTDKEQEALCLRQLWEDKNGQVLWVVCMWNDRTIDMISGSLRKQLLELHPANADARILLRGANGINAVPLGVTVPK